MRRQLAFLDSHPAGPIPPTPFDVVISRRKDRRRLREPGTLIAVEWMESGSAVTGFFLEVGGKRFRFEVFDPASEEMRSADSVLRVSAAFLISPKERREDFPDAALPLVTLSQEVSDRLFSGDLKDVRAGLLLSNGQESTACQPVMSLEAETKTGHGDAGRPEQRKRPEGHK
ncbi:MAG: hypothetical protein ABSG86_15480 [Thermoguttaceae bacterium]